MSETNRDFYVTYELMKDGDTLVQVPEEELHEDEDEDSVAVEKLNRNKADWYIEDVKYVEKKSDVDNVFRITYTATKVSKEMVKATDREEAKNKVGKHKMGQNFVNKFISVRPVTTEDADVDHLRQLEDEDLEEVPEPE